MRARGNWLVVGLLLGGIVLALALREWTGRATHARSEVVAAGAYAASDAEVARVEVTAPDVEDSSRREWLLKARGPVEGPEAPPLAADPSDRFRGHVRDGRSGASLAGVAVLWRGNEVEFLPGNERAPVAVTDAEGRFDLPRCDRVAWLVHAEHAPLAFLARPRPAEAPARKILLHGDPESRSLLDEFHEERRAEPVTSQPAPDWLFEFELWPAAALELRLVGPRGACRNLEVVVSELAAPDELDPRLPELFLARHEVRFDDEGRARFEGLRAHVPHSINGRDLEHALVLAPGELRVEPFLCPHVPLTGIVTDPAGRPLENARVSASSAPFEKNLRVQTGRDGRFGYASLGSGAWWLEAHSEDGRFGTLQRLELVDQALDVRLMLDPTLELVGRVLREDGTPAHGEVRLQASLHPEHVQTAALASDGTFRFEMWRDEEFLVSVVGVDVPRQRARPGQGELSFRVPVPPEISEPEPEIRRLLQSKSSPRASDSSPR